jgi:negative regulator of sigma E activity
MYRRRVGMNMVTVLGEAPPACVARIGKSIQFRSDVR